MADNIATLGVKIDSKDVKTLNAELDKLGKTSESVEKSVNKIGSGLSKLTVETNRSAASEKKRSSAINEIIRALSIQQIKTRDGIEGLTKYNLALLGASDAEKKMASDVMAGTNQIKKARKEESDQIKANSASFKASMAEQVAANKQADVAEKARVSGINAIISSLAKEEQSLNMSKEGIVKYNLALLGASDTEKKAAKEILDRINSIKAAQKAEHDQIKNQKEINSAEEKRKQSINEVINSLKQQEIKLREGKAGLTDYRLSVLGASDAERKQAKELNNKIAKMQEANKTMKQSLGDLLSFTKITAIIFVVSKVGSAIKGLLRDVVDVTKSFQSMQISLNAATGSLEAGAESYAFLRKESERLGLVFTDQIKGFSAIAAAAKDTTLEGESVREIYLGIAEASTVMQLSSEDTVGALKAVSDIMSKGTLQAEEIRGQLGDRLPGAFQIAAKAMDMTTEELNKQLKAGKVLSEDFIPKFAKALREQYAGSVEDAGQSINANLSRMENAFTELKKAAYDAFSDDINDLIKETTGFIVEFKDRIDDPDIQEDIRDIAGGLRAMVQIGLQIGSLAIEFSKLIAPIQKVNDTIAAGINPWKIYNRFIKEIAGDTGEALKQEDKNTRAFLKRQKNLWNQWEKETNDIIKARNKLKVFVDRDAESIDKIIKSLQEENDNLSLSKEELLKKQAAQAGANKEDLKTILTLYKKNEALELVKEKEKEAEKANEEAIQDAKQRQNSINNIILKLKEQIATFNEGGEVSAEYQLRQLGASDAEILLAKNLGFTLDSLKDRKKLQEAYTKVIEQTTEKTNELSKVSAKAVITKAFTEGLISLEQYKKDIAQIDSFFSNIEKKEVDKTLSDITKELEKLYEIKGTNFGNEMADGINNAVISMNDLNKTFEENKKIQDKVAEAQKLINSGKGSPEERAKANEILAKGESAMIEKSLSGYRQLFGTTSQLFKENSRERKALHDIEMAFAAAEIAMNLQKTISNAYVAITNEGAGDPYTAFARVAAMTVLMGGIVAAAGGSLGGSSGSSSVSASSPSKNTNTVLGGSSDEGSQSVSNALEFMQDIEAKQYSELSDINKGVEDLNRNITGLVTSILRAGGTTDFSGIEGTSGGPSGVEKLVGKALTPWGALGIPIDLINNITNGNEVLNTALNTLSLGLSGVNNWLTGIGNKVADAVFGGSKKVSVVAQGLEVATTKVGDILDGMVIDINAFADTRTKITKGWLSGGGSSYVDDTIRKELNDESIKHLFTNVFNGIGETMVATAESLGIDKKVAESIEINLGKINLQGLETTDEINKAISDAINASIDTASVELFSSLIGIYQKAGEGMLETAVRVATERVAILDILETTGTNMIGLGIHEISIAITQSISDLAGGLENLQDAFATYYDNFFTEEEKQIKLTQQLTGAFSSMGLALPGAREEFKKLVSAQQIYTEEGQRNYITLLGLSEAADKYYSALEDVAESTKKAAEAQMEQEKAQKEALAKQEQNLIIQLLQAEGKTLEATTMQRKIELDTMDASLRPLQERIWALQDAAKSDEEATASIEKAASERKSLLETLIKNTVDAQIDGLQKIADAANENLSKATDLLNRSVKAEKEKLTNSHEQIIQCLTKNLDEAKAAADNLENTFNSLSEARKNMNLSGTEQIQYQTAQTQLFSALGLAKTGDFSGAKAVAQDTSALTQDTKGFYSNFEDYQRDFFKTKIAITELEGLTGNALDEQKTMVSILETQIMLENDHFDKTILSLDEQIDKILGVDKSVISLAEAITAYQEAQYAADGANTLLKKQTEQLNNIMNTLFDTNAKTGNLFTLVDEYLHPEKYKTPEQIQEESDATKKTAELTASLLDEIKKMREEMESANYTNAKSNMKTASVLNKWDKDGMPATTA